MSTCGAKFKLCYCSVFLLLDKRPNKVSGTLLIFHLLTGHLLTDICWSDICWLGLDICWLRHLLILATPAICWLWKDVCWFRHLLIQTIADSVITHISVFTTAVYHFNAQRGTFVHLSYVICQHFPKSYPKTPEFSRNSREISRKLNIPANALPFNYRKKVQMTSLI